MEEVKKLTISNPERIKRIIARICENKLQVVLRKSRDANIVVKGRAIKLFLDTEVAGIRIGQISAQGIEHLSGVNKIQVEFSMMSTKVAFFSHVIVREPGSIVLTMPGVLHSIERRKNARFATTRNSTAFLVPNDAEIDDWDLASPPILMPYRKLKGYMQILDVSVGGLSAITQYPRMATILGTGANESSATLHLPGQHPFSVGLSVRWTKKITEHVEGNSNLNSQNFIGNNVISYRFGFQFTEDPTITLPKIASFIRQISHAEAI